MNTKSSDTSNVILNPQTPPAELSTNTLDKLNAPLKNSGYWLMDHLGNTRVTFRPDAQQTYAITYAADYYPFGKVLREYKPCTENRFLSTHHERDAVSGYDNRGARSYDSELGRFLGVDPLAAKFAAHSPYHYAYNNPILFIDPDGRSASSPIFDHDGNFLGTDSEGYTGEIVIMRAQTYNALTNNGSETLDHSITEKIMGTGNPMFAAGVNEAGLTSEGFSKVFTHVMKQMEGETVDGNALSFDNLEGGIVNITQTGTDDEGNLANVNLFGNPNNPRLNAVAAQSYSESSEINVTMRLDMSGQTPRTHVEDAQSTLGVHEYYGHGVKRLRDGDGPHRQVYQLQVDHKRTYNKLQPDYRKTIKRRAKSYKTRN